MGGTKYKAKQIGTTTTRFIQKLGSVLAPKEGMDHHAYIRQRLYSSTEKMG